MDAEKLLKAYGWSGSGSLDSHNGAQSRGLSKPLLISKKVDVLGVGLNKHAAVSDQWWMRAYDSGLKDLGTGKKSTLAQVREKGMFAGGLYGRFVKGESEGGTIQQWNEELKKRKREDDDSGYDSLGKKAKTEVAEKVKKTVSRRVDAFTQEARKRGLLEIRVVKNRALEGKAKGKSIESLYGEDAVARVFKDAGLEPSNKEDRKKQDKYDREKRVRRFRQAAKSFVISQLTQEEQAQLEAIDYIRDKTHEEKQRDRRRTRIEKAEAKAAKKAAKEQKRLQDIEMKAWERDMTSGAYLQYRKDKKRAKKQGVLLERYYGQQERTEELVEVEADLEDLEADDQRQPGVPQVTHDEEETESGSVQVVDKEGKVRYTLDPEVPVPLDPSIWAGIGARSLPKRVRKARRQWMENQREAKKAAEGAAPTTKQAESKNARKIARQEAMTMKILSESRKQKKGKGAGKTASIEGVGDVPLIDVTTKSPEPFTTEEMADARTLARKVLKEQKRKKKAGEASA
ncbi:hypothetical protein CBER1_05845 [Cercospora berteroae]|uniref:G-patch domain-containing protein n=1 Tax=Cercospora berteroae TaxID=357750 RepID=A0A2S6C2K3_9PEZI|nr:hypothetical protein CBER1_05845 [Cercospora berteroae]